MCNLCSTDPKEAKAAKDHHREVASRLRELAKNYEQLAYGEIKPHTPGVEIVGIRARSLVRDLVEEWV